MNVTQRSDTRLLLCSRDGDSLLAMQHAVFRDSGYQVIATASKEEIYQHIENTDFDVIILNHTLSFADRKTLAKKAKQTNPSNGVLVLHHSGSLGNPYVDLAVDSRAGVKPVLDTLKRIEAMRHAALTMARAPTESMLWWLTSIATIPSPPIRSANCSAITAPC
jgi:DNA-binding NarL/FixJ family response regulator